MNYTPEVAASFRRSWAQATIDADKTETIAAIIAKIVRNKVIYMEVALVIGCPWWMIAALHYRESGMNFSAHLHNGDPLTRRTSHVPAGRPLAGNPPFLWRDSAIDALRLKGLDKIKDWPIERVLFECERYNGWGYVGRENSPYVWSGTSLSDETGKYVADHKFNANAIEKQIGCAAIFKALNVGAMPAPIATPAAPETVKPPIAAPAPAESWITKLWKWIFG